MLRTALVGAVVLVLAAGPVAAHHPSGTSFASGPDHQFGEMVSYPLVFPVDGDYWFEDWFYEPRGGGSLHHAQDIMADKMTPVLAAASGTIQQVNWSSTEAGIDPNRCCTIALKHDDGWSSWYIHLNNDTPGTDDGKGWGIVDGIVPGVKVTAGQHIGWVGDSGNAEDTDPHLHFELIDPHGVIVNPYQSLLDALDGKGLQPGGSSASGVTFLHAASANRRQAAAEVSRRTHPNGADTVIVIPQGFAKGVALAAGPASVHLDAPILLANRDKLPPATVKELQRLQPSRVIVVGTAAQVRGEVLTQARALLPNADITRVAGRNRWMAAANVVNEVFEGTASVVYVTDGKAFPNVTVAAHLAAVDGAPMLITKPGHLTKLVSNTITRLSPSRIVVVGDRISDSVMSQLATLAPQVTRVSAHSGAATAGLTSDTAYAAVNRSYPNAIFAANVVAGDPGPLLLPTPSSVPSSVRDQLTKYSPKQVVVLTRPGVVSGAVIAGLGDWKS